MTRRRWALALTCVAFAFVADAAFAQAPPAASAPSPAPVKPPDPVKPADPSKPAPSGTDAVVLDAAALEAIIGLSVKSRTGEDMGRIVDMLVPTSGQVRAAVIDFGGFLGVGSRRIAVDWKALNFTDVAKSSNVIVALTRNQVRMAPEYKQGDPIVILEAKPDDAKPAPAPIPVSAPTQVSAPKPPAAPDPQKK